MRKKILFILLWIVSMHCVMAQDSELQQLIEGLREQYAPDRRVELFTVTTSRQDDTLVLGGMTTSAEAYEVLLARTKKRYPRVVDKIRVLPDEELGNNTWGLIYNSVATIRAEPRYSSEMVTQALLGTPVRVLEKQGGWRRIQTPDRYIGWVNGSVQPVSKEILDDYLKQPKIIVSAQSTTSFEKPDSHSLPISDLVTGNMLAIQSEEESYFRVRYPDGREAYVCKMDAQPMSEWLEGIELTGESIVDYATRLIGIPYVWGGTSTKGLDCSGFTKQVYFMHGIVLARDASQQVMQGQLVDTVADFRNARPGDLVFFGSQATDAHPKERVVHVGIYLGDNRFIHASDYIRINSFDPNDPLYDKFNANRYLRTKRMIESGQAIEVGTLGNTPFYNP